MGSISGGVVYSSTAERLLVLRSAVRQLAAPWYPSTLHAHQEPSSPMPHLILVHSSPSSQSCSFSHCDYGPHGPYRHEILISVWTPSRHIQTLYVPGMSTAWRNLISSSSESRLANRLIIVFPPARRDEANKEW